MPRKLIQGPERRTHPLVWCIAILCTVVAIAVIIVGLVVFVGYLVIHPSVPVISVVTAHLDKLQNDLAGLFETQLTIYVKAENDNAKAHASFSDTSFVLSFEGIAIARLVADPFDVAKNGSVEFPYRVESSSIPLNPEEMLQVDLALKQDKITFDLKGSSRARWKVGLLGSVKFWCHLNCRLKFHPLTGVYLEMRLNDLHCELENLVWDKKQLELHLQTAIREHKMMEMLLDDLEHEHDKAISTVQLLQDELQELKNENLRLLEVQGKGYWNFTGKDNDNKYGTPSSDETGIILQDSSMIHPVPNTQYELLKLLKPESNDVFDHRRGAAITQSLFSAVLSLLVGMIIWKAEDPCMPLVVALFTVVGMSLKTVVQFFSTIKNKPASDSVALLSLNWFILGTLTYPTLPIVARMLSPVALRIVNGAASLTGLSFS
uniref:Uncharacterized protein n=1 Tax=Cannabis sativa TaxID=3483 RepID=A0A803QHI9_CANSA